MLKSEQINELSAALAKAQSEIENASKTSSNPHFKSKYADLAEILNTVRPVFSAHGLAIVQMPSFESGVAHVETLLTHSSGQWISNVCSAPVGKQDAQGVGSAITYLRRYSLAAFAGVAQEDDDANGAVGKAQPAQKPVSIKKQPLNAERFAAAIGKVKDGSYEWERLANDWELTEAQREELRLVVESL